ncbi:CsbD family protein [Agrococcus casei]|uniref:CsbD-like domain-containing protein n=1 Tax=Agrococcus casei LMG 22410 TaxID=1255656 RepID=A0A1R4G8B3_9MICO|nr:CsbD family protein [Agrococcus casei]SJM64460.1 hypothetical protein CZ674_09830 [Agrococcus casei LMG 22410]
MSFGGDISNKAKDFGGQAKEKFGEATGNEEVEREGQAQQGEAAADSLKDKVGDTFDKVRDGAEGAGEKVSGFVKGIFDKDDKGENGEK